MAATGRRRSCVLCQGPLGPVVNELLAAGLSANRIERRMRDLGKPVKRETIGRHLAECMSDDPAGFIELESIAERIEADGGVSKAASRDLAKVVQGRAIRALQHGALPVTVKDGLVAQKLIDRRAERNKDHEFVLNLARLLSGGGQGPPPALVGSGEAIGSGERD